MKQYKCSIGKPIPSCGKCDHSKPHKLNFTCDGTCYGEGHETNEGKKVEHIVVRCFKIPESIEAEEI